MADFHQIQEKFDKDPELRKRFLRDPIGVLRELDVILGPQQAFQLQQDVANFQKQGPSPAGVHVGVTAVFPILRIDW